MGSHCFPVTSGVVMSARNNSSAVVYKRIRRGNDESLLSVQTLKGSIPPFRSEHAYLDVITKSFSRTYSSYFKRSKNIRSLDDGEEEPGFESHNSETRLDYQILNYNTEGACIPGGVVEYLGLPIEISSIS